MAVYLLHSLHRQLHPNKARKGCLSRKRVRRQMKETQHKSNLLSVCLQQRPVLWVYFGSVFNSVRWFQGRSGTAEWHGGKWFSIHHGWEAESTGKNLEWDYTFPGDAPVTQLHETAGPNSTELNRRSHWWPWCHRDPVTFQKQETFESHFGSKA